MSAPFPLARTSAVIAAKAWYVLTAGSRQERLRRYLNEELAALYGAPLPSDDEKEEALNFRTDRTADYLAVGATAGLAPVYRKKPRPWDAPFLARPAQAKSEAAPPSETQLVKDVFRASGLQEGELAGLPYSLLSAATHGRFRHAGLVLYALGGRRVARREGRDAGGHGAVDHVRGFSDAHLPLCSRAVHVRARSGGAGPAASAGCGLVCNCVSGNGHLRRYA